ncbi:hypothetical protein [Neptuniibacter sp. QD37_11]|uniref:hypothetical protein n=1 Tax=Neptuniibacter sp. QD37_11 TaxID=3398209 RepID=UPI0039F5DF32
MASCKRNAAIAAAVAVVATGSFIGVSSVANATAKEKVDEVVAKIMQQVPEKERNNFSYEYDVAHSVLSGTTEITALKVMAKNPDNAAESVTVNIDELAFSGDCKAGSCNMDVTGISFDAKFEEGSRDAKEWAEYEKLVKQIGKFDTSYNYSDADRKVAFMQSVGAQKVGDIRFKIDLTTEKPMQATEIFFTEDEKQRAQMAEQAFGTSTLNGVQLSYVDRGGVSMLIQHMSEKEGVTKAQMLDELKREKSSAEHRHKRVIKRGKAEEGSTGFETNILNAMNQLVENESGSIQFKLNLKEPLPLPSLMAVMFDPNSVGQHLEVTYRK